MFTTCSLGKCPNHLDHQHHMFLTVFNSPLRAHWSGPRDLDLECTTICSDTFSTSVPLSEDICTSVPSICLMAPTIRLQCLWTPAVLEFQHQNFQHIRILTYRKSQMHQNFWCIVIIEILTCEHFQHIRIPDKSKVQHIRISDKGTQMLCNFWHWNFAVSEIVIHYHANVLKF